MLEVSFANRWHNSAIVISRFNFEQSNAVSLVENREDIFEESFAALLDKKQNHHFTPADPDRIARMLEAIESPSELPVDQAKATHLASVNYEAAPLTQSMQELSAKYDYKSPSDISLYTALIIGRSRRTSCRC